MERARRRLPWQRDLLRNGGAPEGSEVKGVGRGRGVRLVFSFLFFGGGVRRRKGAVLDAAQVSVNLSDLRPRSP